MRGFLAFSVVEQHFAAFAQWQGHCFKRASVLLLSQRLKVRTLQAYLNLFRLGLHGLDLQPLLCVAAICLGVRGSGQFLAYRDGLVKFEARRRRLNRAVVVVELVLPSGF
jgi:hypothetical protein